MKRVMSAGVLEFECPRCQAILSVGLHVVDAFGERCQQDMAEVHRGHPVEFIAEAPHLHAKFWGHMVRCHQPNPHPYMPSADDELEHQERRASVREIETCCQGRNINCGHHYGRQR